MIIENEEMMEDIECGSGDWEIEEEGDWTQDCKYQNQTNIVKHVPTGKFYSYSIYRSGSPFSDWHYGHEDGDYPELTEVVKAERTVVETYWKAV